MQGNRNKFKFDVRFWQRVIVWIDFGELRQKIIRNNSWMFFFQVSRLFVKLTFRFTVAVNKLTVCMLHAKRLFESLLQETRSCSGCNERARSFFPSFIFSSTKLHSTISINHHKVWHITCYPLKSRTLMKISLHAWIDYVIVMFICVSVCYNKKNFWMNFIEIDKLNVCTFIEWLSESETLMCSTAPRLLIDSIHRIQGM